MTSLFIQSLIIVFALILFAIFASWLDKFRDKDREQLIEKAIDNVSALIESQVDSVMDRYKAGPWYLVVYTEDSDLPLWISNNNIRSVHPDAKHRKLIIKQFNGEDMVVENVENYELCAANETGEYDM